MSDSITTGFLGYVSPAPPYRAATGALHYPGLVYGAVLGYRSLQLDLWVPDSAAPAPLVIWIHGGAWMMGDRQSLPAALRPGQVFEELLAAGLAVASIDYRHAREAPFPAQLHDAKAAVRWLRHHADELGLDTSRIGVWGESAGGHLAALLGLTGDRPDLEGGVGLTGPSSTVDVVVDWYGVSDVSTLPTLVPPPHIAALVSPEDLIPPVDLLLDAADAQMRADVNPLTHVCSASPPFFLVHGDVDTVVPLEQSRRLAAALTAAGVPTQLEVIGGAGHGFDGGVDVDGIVARSVDYLRCALADS